MKLKFNYYTSYYVKMAKRRKAPLDIYIQISRSVVCYAKDLDGVPVTQQINWPYVRYGNNFETFEEYYDFLSTEDMREITGLVFDDIKRISNEIVNESAKEMFGKTFKELTAKEAHEMWLDLGFEDYAPYEVNAFFLCHENLESRYKNSDKAVKDGLIKAGDYKVCHRRVFADWVEDNLGIKLYEYGVTNKDVLKRYVKRRT